MTDRFSGTTVQSLTLEEQQHIRDLCLAHHEELVAYAYCMVCEWDLAEDAVQDTFLDACRNPQRLMTAENSLRWLKKACSLNCYELLRNTTRYRNKNLCFGDLTLLEQAVATEHTSDLEICASFDIRPEDLELLREVYIDARPRKELAAEYGLTRYALSKRVDRLRQKIRQSEKYAEYARRKE